MIGDTLGALLKYQDDIARMQGDDVAEGFERGDERELIASTCRHSGGDAKRADPES